MKEMLRNRHGDESVWRHRDLRLAALARGISFLGDEVATVALVLTAYDAGRGAAGLAAVLVAAAAPVALGAPLAGRLVDRTDSRRATLLAAAVQGLAAIGLAVLLATADHRSPVAGVAALLLVAVLGAGQAVAGPAWQALVPHVVPAAEVPRAVAALQATTTLAGVAGPAAGGLLVASGGAAWALAVDAASFAALAVVALRVRTVRRPGPSDTAGGARAGLAALRADPLLASVVAGLAAVVTLLQAVVVLDVALARDVLGAGPAGYGAVNAGFALALVVGAGLAGRAGAASGPRRQAVGVASGAAGIAACVVAGGLAPTLAGLAVALAGMGLANGLLSVCFGALLATRVPDGVRGRVYATVGGVSQTASLAGLLLGGVVGGLVDPRTGWVALGGGGLLASGLLARAVRHAGHAPLTVESRPMTVESRT